MDTPTPDDATSRPEGPDTGSRRDVLGWLAALPVCAAAWPVLTSLSGAGAAAARPAKLPLCRLADVPDTGLAARNLTFDVRRGPAVERVAEVVFVGRDDQGSVYALSGICPHLACPVQLVGDGRVEASDDDADTGDPAASAPLRCPCHSAAFDREGRVLDGPPERPLRRLRLEIPDDPEGMIQVLSAD